MISFLLRCALGIVGAAIATVGIFAVVKGIFGWPAGGFRDNSGLLLTGVAGFTAYISFLEYRRFARQSGARELAKEWSFRFSAKGDDDLARRFGLRVAGRDVGLVGEKYFGFELENVIQGVRDGVNVLIADLLIIKYLGEGSEDTTLTVISLRDRDLSLPAFTLLPTTPLGSASRSERESGGLVREMSYKGFYRLSSNQPEITDELLSPELQAHLAVHHGWEIRSEDNNVLFVRRDHEPVDRWDSLVAESIQILKMLTNYDPT